jgi:hypothetical protein
MPQSHAFRPVLTAGLMAVAALGGMGCKLATGEAGPSPGAGAAGSGTNPMTGAAGSSSTTGGAGASSSGGAGSGGGGAGAAGTGAPMGPLDIGFQPVGRLNRRQYNNTVHDLLGTALNPSNNFPKDETTLGFDTIAGVLRVAPEHLESYVAAAHTLIDELFARPATDPVRARILSCDHKTAGTDCEKTILKGFATKAWRRPVMDAELTPYLTLATAQPTPDEGLNAALVAMLSSTKFLYRIEGDPDPANTAPHRLTAHELATRLSYFLWSTMPDDALFAAADSGALLTDAGLSAQIDRLLTNTTRARTFIDSFGAQWLAMGRLEEITPDKTAFAAFNDTIRKAMEQETAEFLWDFLANNRPLPQLLTADFTYVNQPLAALYGLPAVTGTAVQKVMTTGTKRSGILTQGTYLAGTSNPTRTSPVKRGIYVLERFLCAAPPPPPNNVNLNIDEGSGLEDLPVRQRLAQHQMKGAGCAACHATMDAIGLGLENFDAIGRYRTSDEYGPIDASAALPIGGGMTKPFAGATELAQILAADTRLVPCVVEKLGSFGLGRDFGSNLALRNAVAASATAGGGSLKAAIVAVVTHDAFRSRRAAAQTEVKP